MGVEDDVDSGGVSDGTVIKRRVKPTEGSRARRMDGLGDAAVRADGEVVEEKRRLERIRELNRVGNKKNFDADPEAVWDRDAFEAAAEAKVREDLTNLDIDLDLGGKATKMKSAAARRRAEAKRRAETAVLGEYQRGPGERGDGDDQVDGGAEDDSREYGWDQADVKEMQKQYENFLKASKANKWWKRGDERE